MRKHIKSFVIILICLGLSGCGVESKVTIAQNQILIPPYRENVFEFTTCKKGELVNKLSITCYCRPEEINEPAYCMPINNYRELNPPNISKYNMNLFKGLCHDFRGTAPCSL